MEMRDIVGWEDLYAVTDDGRVWSKRSEKYLKVGVAANGYEQVALSRSGESKTVRVHRLVCEAFNGSPIGENMVVDHIDGNKRNNRAVNLRWVTQSQNVRSAHDLHLCDDRPVVAFNEEGDVIHFSSGRAARAAGFRPETVLARKTFLSKGYAFVYEEEWPLPIGVYFEQMAEVQARGQMRKRKGPRKACKVRGTSLADGSTIEFPSMNAARMAGFSGAENCVNGRAKSCKGYVWEKVRD